MQKKNVWMSMLFLGISSLVSAQTIFTPTGTMGTTTNPSSGNVGVRSSSPQFPFQIWDGGTNTFTGVSIIPGNNPTQNAQLFALKDFGFLLHTGGQDSGYGQSGIFLGSSLGNQKTTFLSQSFEFKVIDYTTLLNGPNFGIKVMELNNNILRLDGELKAKLIRVVTNVWADYVFGPNFKLRPLSEVEGFIKENKHLPDVPSEKEVVENGLNVGEMQKIQMQKIEELTLYLIQQQKEINALKKENEELKKLIKNKKGGE